MGLSTFDAFKNLRIPNGVVLDDTQIRQLQQVLLGILKDIVSVCEANGITYTLGGGTALGAARHHGFIPWDDDIDLNMPRADYERFIPLFLARFKDKYWVHTPQRTHNYALLMTKIRLKGTTVKTRDDFWNKECGAFVDIFVMENTFDNALLRTIHGFGSLALGFLLSCRKFYRDRRFLMPLADGNRALARTFRVKIAVGFLLAWSSIDLWTHLADRWDRMCKDDESAFITIPAGRKRFFGELYPRQAICEIETVPFEDMQAAIMRQYDRYLVTLYGDWKQIEPKEKREWHAFFKPFILS